MTMATDPTMVSARGIAKYLGICTLRPHELIQQRAHAGAALCRQSFTPHIASNATLIVWLYSADRDDAALDFPNVCVHQVRDRQRI
jgi:hypothetical protein